MNPNDEVLRNLLEISLLWFMLSFSLLIILSYVSCDGWEEDEEKGLEDESEAMALESLKTWRKNLFFVALEQTCVY